MKIFISSVNAGLEDERKSLPSIITALRHTPIYFEKFGAQNVPSRTACLEAVADSDVYLLILGPKYGHRFPETGQSATHDEWQAAKATGKPIYVFRKTGVVFESEQEEFARQVGDYGQGRFYKQFATVEELMSAVAEAVRDAEDGPDTLDFAPLSEPVSPRWLEPAQRSGVTTPQLEVHMVPVAGNPVSERVLQLTGQRLPSLLRAEGLVSQYDALELNEEQDAILVSAPPAQRRSGLQDVEPSRFDGVRLLRSGEVGVFFTLAGDGMGRYLDREQSVDNVTRALQLAHRLEYISTERSVIAVGLTSTQMVNFRAAPTTRQSSASFFYAADGPVRAPVDESVPTSSISVGAREISMLQVDAILRAGNRR